MQKSNQCHGQVSKVYPSSIFVYLMRSLKNEQKKPRQLRFHHKKIDLKAIFEREVATRKENFEMSWRIVTEALTFTVVEYNTLRIQEGSNHT